MDFGQKLWQLRIAVECLDHMDNDDLFIYYRYAFHLKIDIDRESSSMAERRCISKLLEDLEQECVRRGMPIVAVYFKLDRDGQFLCGRQELKELWKKISFEQMVDAGDEILASCVTEKQRIAIIDLEREIVEGI